MQVASGCVYVMAIIFVSQSLCKPLVKHYIFYPILACTGLSFLLNDPVWLFSSFFSFLHTGVITKAVHKSSEEEKKEEEVKKTLEQHDSIVTQYKELIREQVRKL